MNYIENSSMMLQITSTSVVQLTYICKHLLIYQFSAFMYSLRINVIVLRNAHFNVELTLSVLKQAYKNAQSKKYSG